MGGVYKTAEERFAAAASREAAPEAVQGGVTCGTPESIERFRMITCLTGLSLESKGIRVNRHVSMLRVARREYGIKARNASTAYIRLRQLMEEKGIIVHDGRPHEIGKEDTSAKDR